MSEGGATTRGVSSGVFQRGAVMRKIELRNELKRNSVLLVKLFSQLLKDTTVY